MLGYVYKTTNLINGKIYIGQHHKPRFERSYLGSGKNIIIDIKKYGKQSFEVEILEWCETQEEMDCKELYHIQKYYNKSPECLYNIITTHIARGKKDMFKPETLKQKSIMMSGNGNHMYNIKLVGNKNGMYGKSHTDETKQILSEIAIKLQNGKKNKGLIRSEEFKKKISESKRGAITLQSKKDIISKMLTEKEIFYNDLPKIIRNIIAAYRCGYYQKEKTLRTNIIRLCEYLNSSENVTILIGEYKKNENFYKGK